MVRHKYQITVTDQLIRRAAPADVAGADVADADVAGQGSVPARPQSPQRRALTVATARATSLTAGKVSLNGTAQGEWGPGATTPRRATELDGIRQAGNSSGTLTRVTTGNVGTGAHQGLTMTRRVQTTTSSQVSGTAPPRPGSRILGSSAQPQHRPGSRRGFAGIATQGGVASRMGPAPTQSRGAYSTVSNSTVTSGTADGSKVGAVGAPRVYRTQLAGVPPSGTLQGRVSRGASPARGGHPHSDRLSGCSDSGESQDVPETAAVAVGWSSSLRPNKPPPDLMKARPAWRAGIHRSTWR